jgi:hypothetical protein
MRALRIIAATGAIAAGVSAFPALAHADDPCTGDAPGCPTFGHLVCQQIDAGLTSSQIAANAMAAYNLTKIMAASLVAGAIVKYCPSYEGN